MSLVCPLPKSACYWLGTRGSHKVLTSPWRVHFYDNEETHKHMIMHAHIISCQGLLQVWD